MPKFRHVLLVNAASCDCSQTDGFPLKQKLELGEVEALYIRNHDEKYEGKQ